MQINGSMRKKCIAKHNNPQSTIDFAATTRTNRPSSPSVVCICTHHHREAYKYADAYTHIRGLCARAHDDCNQPLWVRFFISCMHISIFFSDMAELHVYKCENKRGRAESIFFRWFTVVLVARRFVCLLLEGWQWECINMGTHMCRERVLRNKFGMKDQVGG